MWMVRNGGGDYVDDFLSQGIVSIGWSELGSLANVKTREAVLTRVQEVWPNNKQMQTVVAASQIDKFVNVMKVGDAVVTYDPSKRIYHIGKIVGGYEFDGAAENILSNRRKVIWEHQVRRDDLSDTTKNSLGSTLTVFSVPESAVRELTAPDHSQTVPGEKVVLPAEEEVVTRYSLEELQVTAKEKIKDKLAALNWDEMQQLVAGLLRAMGYKTQISPQGPDRGKDIVASPDGLGLETPRIVVEVKARRNEQMGSPQIRSFLGGRHKDDRGLYVSTGGFSKDAKYEAERASIPLALMDIDELAAMLINYYDNLDPDMRTLLPLSKLYWPI